jgi:hypothetical protein
MAPRLAEVYKRYVTAGCKPVTSRNQGCTWVGCNDSHFWWRENQHIEGRHGKGKDTRLACQCTRQTTHTSLTHYTRLKTELRQVSQPLSQGSASIPKVTDHPRPNSNRHIIPQHKVGPPHIEGEKDSKKRHSVRGTPPPSQLRARIECPTESTPPHGEPTTHACCQGPRSCECSLMTMSL